MRAVVGTICVIAAALALFWGVSSAAGIDRGAPASVGGIKFVADVVARPAIKGPATIEISYAVAHDELLFVRCEDGYRARFEITVVLYDEDGRQIEGDSWRRAVDVANYEETNARTEAVREILTLFAEPGRYRLKIEISSLDTRAVGLIETRVVVPELSPGKLTVGTLLFECEDGQAGEAGRTILNPGREYGEDRPTVFLRVPVYGDPGTRYKLGLFVETTDGLIQWSVVDTVIQSTFLTETVRQFDALTLEVGTYVARVRVCPLTGGDAIVTRASFRVLTSPRSWGEDFQKMVAQVSYFATRDEVEWLLDVEPDERDAAWETFWRSLDPDPTTEENEVKNEFLRRLGYVNVQFRSVVEGWQTDMGRIYIQYGEPDDVDSQPIGRSLDAWEIWYYYREHTKFTFIDREGFGEYKLVETSRI